jgi:hypothetical protein
MENDAPACLPAALPAGCLTPDTASGCRQDRLTPRDILRLAWRRALHAPPWTYVGLAALGFLAAVLLALV